MGLSDVLFSRMINLRYMLVILRDIYHGHEWSEMSRDEMFFVTKVAFIESISESTLQLIISCLVLRSYGIGTDALSLFSQIFSFSTSLISIVVSFGSVSTSVIVFPKHVLTMY